MGKMILLKSVRENRFSTYYCLETRRTLKSPRGVQRGRGD